MFILGIDPGTRVAGYGLVELRDKGLHAARYGVLRGKPGGSIGERLEKIYEGLADMLRECRPDSIAIEGAFHGKNSQVAIRMGEARGVVLLCAAQFGVPVVEYSPAEVKRAVVGGGRAAKIQVQKMVKVLLSLDEIPEPADAADALAIAICHCHRLTTERRIRRDP